ncbi:2-oxoacid:acceptor oxidoreductase family protein, partial [Nocardia asiatica]|uniref:2-oxoacid:acceptor oxidoreductase family protein n=1 Tax=Nocardia asiatica TaxID=209252 RepID=UPI0005C18EDC
MPDGSLVGAGIGCHGLTVLMDDRQVDQTGLAQKGGAVVSDVKIFSEFVAEANRVGEGQCDLYLGCDLLVAADPRYLTAARPGRTAAVVSMTKVPTGAMVIDPDVSYPPVDELLGSIRAATEGAEPIAFDARDIAATLFRSDQFANVLLLGAAYQAGRIPLSAAHIEEAVRLGKVRIEQNIQAFRRGRQAVAAPQALNAALGAMRHTATQRTVIEGSEAIMSHVRTAPGSPLAAVLEVRVPELIAYQNRDYACDYATLVERIRAAEAAAVPEGPGHRDTVITTMSAAPRRCRHSLRSGGRIRHELLHQGDEVGRRRVLQVVSACGHDVELGARQSLGVGLLLAEFDDLVRVPEQGKHRNAAFVHHRDGGVGREDDLQEGEQLEAVLHLLSDVLRRRPRLVGV